MNTVEQLVFQLKRNCKSEYELSEKTGIPQPNINRTFNNHTKPTLKTFIELANGLGYEIKLIKQTTVNKRIKL